MVSRRRAAGRFLPAVYWLVWGLVLGPINEALGVEGAPLRAGARSIAILPALAEAIDQVASRSYLRFVRAVGLKILKNKLSEYVRLAAGGETVLVTDRDRVVAELVPLAARPRRTPADAELAEAVRKGWLTPPALVTSGHRRAGPYARLDVLLAELAADRADS